MDLANTIVSRMAAIKYSKLRQEYAQLERKLDQCISSGEFTAELERRVVVWEKANSDTNEQALRAVGRYMPVNVKTVSEAALLFAEVGRCHREYGPSFQELMLLRHSPEHFISTYESLLRLGRRQTGQAQCPANAVGAGLYAAGPKGTCVRRRSERPPNEEDHGHGGGGGVAWNTIHISNTLGVSDAVRASAHVYS
ncbi:hypothetical protein ON010_g19114 [Phytophthora cinnamomi]|nr:hypothetical protein ON010_g19114 [Phytophthora cinnamomi]